MDNAPPTSSERAVSRAAKLGLGLVVLCAVVNTVRTRTLRDFLQYSALVYAPLAVLSIAFTVVDRPPSGRTLRDRLSDIWMALLGFAVLAPLFYSVGAFLRDTYLWIQSPSLTKTQAMVAGAAITAVLGGGLFYFRLRLRSIYGASEAIVGVMVATQRIATESEAAAKQPAFYLALLTAGVYLVVRGLDNVHQGLAKEPVDLLAARIVKRMNWFSLPKAAQIALQRRDADVSETPQLSEKRGF